MVLILVEMEILCGSDLTLQVGETRPIPLGEKTHLAIYQNPGIFSVVLYRVSCYLVILEDHNKL